MIRVVTIWQSIEKDAFILCSLDLARSRYDELLEELVSII